MNFYILIFLFSYLVCVNADFGCHKGACWKHCGGVIKSSFGAWCYTGNGKYTSCSTKQECNSIDNVFYGDAPCYGRCSRY